ncbi:hypothetical protein ABZ319_10715 [Nocardia sp. NPDC005978]|uniref:hypothetical protein n=1 Tax=Nocardia sp. NPDC005978 TaxID=3156725 RepID=UPI0033A79851
MTTPAASGSVESGAPGAMAGAQSQVLSGTALGANLDLPINDILSGLGLPNLPQLPAAPIAFELPPLPTLDLSVLTRPLTDLASSFGTGQLGQGLNVDPTAVLDGISSALQTAMSLASTVAQLASSWQGSGAAGATDKAAAAQTNTTELAGQNVQQKTILVNASTTVATGAASISAIIAKFLAAVTASAPFLVTPPGQVFLLSMATESAAEASAVVAKTKAELTVQSAQMTTAGEKVKVTEAPGGVDALSQVTQLLSLISPLASVATTGAETVQKLQDIAQPVVITEDAAPVADPIDSAAALGGGGGGMPIGALVGSTAPVAQSLTPRTAAAPPVAPGVAADAPAVARVAGPGGTGMMPPMGMMGAGMGGRAGLDESEGGDDVRTQMVTSEHGDDVVGELGNTGVAVVGAAGSTSTRAVQS